MIKRSFGLKYEMGLEFSERPKSSFNKTFPIPHLASG